MIKLSPSNLDYYNACPCFAFKPFNREGSAAEEGTKMHAAFETGDDDDLSGEQQKRVQQTRDIVEAQKIAFLDWAGAPIERRIELHEQKLKGSFGIAGKMDRAYVNLANRKAFIFDSKYGRAGLIADACDSLQLASYTDIVNTQYPGLIDETLVMLYAPRSSELSHHLYRFSDWDSIKSRIEKVINEVDDPFKQPRFNDAVCAKCAHIDRCPVAKGGALVPIAAKSLPIPTHVLTKPVDQLTPDEIAQNKAIFDLMSAWIEKREPELNARVFAEGIELPGYTKVKKNGSAYIPADKASRAWELLRADLSPEQFIAACAKPSIGKLVDQLADSIPGEDLSERREKARAHLVDTCEEVIVQMKGSEYLRRKAKLNLKLIGAGSE